MTVNRILVVGAAAAGFSAAEGLRRFGYNGELVLVGDECDPPYDRPPMSKQLLAGTWEPERALLLPRNRLDGIGASIVPGLARWLDVHGHKCHLSSGETVDYDHVVIATGVHPRTLPDLSPDTARGVIALRTLADSTALRAALRPGRRVVIVGAGFIGLEVAATAVTLGARVQVVEPVTAPLADRVGTTTAHRLLTTHREHGVEFRTGTAVDQLLTARGRDGHPFVVGVRCSDGEELDADVVVVAIGCRPTTDWLEGSELEIDDGVVCDEYCNAGRGVWAAGDVARWYHAGMGRHMRIEHRLNATEQGIAVARNIVGPQQPFTPTPFFWTDQYNVRIQLAGEITSHSAPTIEYGDPHADSFVESFSVDGEMRGVVAWNASKELMPFRRELMRTFAAPQPANATRQGGAR